MSAPKHACAALLTCVLCAHLEVPPVGLFKVFADGMRWWYGAELQYRMHPCLADWFAAALDFLVVVVQDVGAACRARVLVPGDAVELGGLVVIAPAVLADLAVAGPDIYTASTNAFTHTPARMATAQEGCQCSAMTDCASLH